MLKKFIFTISLVFVSFIKLAAIDHFVFMDNQKSGTWLFFKAMYLLRSKEHIFMPWIHTPNLDPSIPTVDNFRDFDRYIQQYLKEDKFLFDHFQRPDFEDLEEYLERYNFKKVILTRDLRDIACSSLQFHIIEGNYKEKDKVEQGRSLQTRDQQLLFVIEKLMNARNKIDELLTWYRNPEVLTVRF